jgi:rod shape-determining protein MreD
MVRAALATKRRIGQGPKRLAVFVPAASVVAASFLAALPIISQSGWYPDFGFLVLISWRLLRSDPWPGWWAAPMGLANDLLSGFPIGLSVALWSGTMLALDLVDRRTMWRDYWIEWGLATVLIAINEWLQWRVAAIGGARVPIQAMVPPLALSVCVFPLSAWVISRIDRWRLSR